MILLLIEILSSKAIQIENGIAIVITELGKVFIDSFEGLEGLFEIAVNYPRWFNRNRDRTFMCIWHVVNLVERVSKENFRCLFVYFMQ